MPYAAGTLVLLFSLAASDAAGQAASWKPTTETLAGAERAAREAVGTFAQLVTPKNAREMGFESPEEVRTATVGAPLPEYIVQLDELRRYDAGTSPGRLLHESGLFLFPVLVGTNVRSSLTIQHERGAFRAVAFGAPAFMQRTSRALDGRPGSVLVRVPSLNVFFVAFSEGDRLLFASVLDDTRFGLKSGEPVPAEKALERLVPAAKEHTGLPS